MTNYDTFDFKQIGQAIKQERLKLGLTRNEFSDKIGIKPDYLIKIENTGRTPSIDVLVRIVRYLNLSVDRYFQYSAIDVNRTLKFKKIENMLMKFSDEDLELVHLLIENIIEWRGNKD